MRKFDYSANKTIQIWLPPKVMESLQSKKREWTHLTMTAETTQHTEWWVNGLKIRMKRKLKK